MILFEISPPSPPLGVPQWDPSGPCLGEASGDPQGLLGSMRASRHQYRRPILPFRGPYRVPKESYTPIERFQGLPITQGALWTNIWVLSVS